MFRASPKCGELVFSALAVGRRSSPRLPWEDHPGDGVAAFVAVDMDADAAAVGVAVDVDEQVQRLGGATEFGDRAAERGGPPAALKDAQQLGGADGAGGERAGDAQDVVPVSDDRAGVDAVAREPVERPVVGVAVDSPETLVGQRRGAGAELVAGSQKSPKTW